MFIYVCIKLETKIFKGHIPFSLLNFDFTVNFYILVPSKYLGNNLGSSTIGNIGKTMFTAEFLAVANTLTEEL